MKNIKLKHNFKNEIGKYLILGTLSIFSILIIWIPFYLQYPIWGINVGHQGLATIVANFDGPYYIAIAKSLYSNEVLKQFEFNLPIEYYAAHFPLYPLILKLFANLGGYVYATLLVSLLTSVGATLIFYKFAKYLKLSNPFFLTVVFIFFPARLLITRSIGSPEPLFLFFTIGSIMSFMKRSYWISALFGSMAVLTKPPGVLLGVAYFIYLSWNFLLPVLVKPKNLLKFFPYKALPLLLMPLSLLGLFTYYAQKYGSIWAYFESGDNIHLFWPPFQMFNRDAFWVGSFWLEDLIWLLLILIIAVIILWERRDVISVYVTVFTISLAFVEHRDIARYALPLAPFAIIAYSELVNHKYFRTAFFIIILPIYLYTINFIAGNTVPISDWSNLL